KPMTNKRPATEVASQATTQARPPSVAGGGANAAAGASVSISARPPRSASATRSSQQFDRLVQRREVGRAAHADPSTRQLDLDDAVAHCDRPRKAGTPRLDCHRE